MVKNHKGSGKPRHYKKNQKKHEERLHGYPCCAECKFRGHASGDRYGSGTSIFKFACFNKASKMYMQRVTWNEHCKAFVWK